MPKVEQAAKVSFQADADSNCTSALRISMGLDLGWHALLTLADVGDDQDRLCSQGREVTHCVGGVSRDGDSAGRLALVESFDYCLDPTLFRDRFLVTGTRLTDNAVKAAFGLVKVGKEKLGLDRVQVPDRVNPALGVDDVRVVVGANDVKQGVGLTDVGEELVAQPFALVGAGDKSGDVMDFHRVVDDFAGTDER
jgi:hypothetical protein